MNKLLYPQTYVVWDLETTGLDYKTCRIVEFGALMVKEGKPIGEFEAILNHGIEIPIEASNIHGITTEKAKKNGIDPKEAMKRAFEIINAYPAHVTHNGMKFDLPFLLEEWRRQELVKEATEQNLYKTALDTAAMFKAMKMEMPRHWNEHYADWALRVLSTYAPGVKYNVGVCCDALQIDRSMTLQHRVMGDIKLTHEIYKKLITI